MDDKTRVRVLTATFALLILAGNLRVITSGGTTIGLLAGMGFWTVACLITAFLVNRVICGLESRRLQD